MKQLNLKDTSIKNFFSFFKEKTRNDAGFSEEQIRQQAGNFIKFLAYESFIKLIQLGYTPSQEDIEQLRNHFRQAILEKNFSRLNNIIKIPSVVSYYLVVDFLFKEKDFFIQFCDFQTKNNQNDEEAEFFGNLYNKINNGGKEYFQQQWFFKLNQEMPVVLEKKFDLIQTRVFEIYFIKYLHNIKEFLIPKDFYLAEKYLEIINSYKQQIDIKLNIPHTGDKIGYFSLYHVNISQAIQNIYTLIHEFYEKNVCEKKIHFFNNASVLLQKNNKLENPFNNLEIRNLLPQDIKIIINNIEEKIRKIQELYNTSHQYSCFIELENLLENKVPQIINNYKQFILINEKEKAALNSFEQAQLLFIKSLMNLDEILDKYIHHAWQEKLKTMQVDNLFLEQKKNQLIIN